MRIRIKYRYKLIRIWLKLQRKLLCADIAALLVRLAFKISPQFERSLMNRDWEDFDA